jgi:Ser/Thr protein kinase RdoA (MazF antagonist)
MRVENFDNFGPDAMIDAVEGALGKTMSGLAAPLPSYINRVYELQTAGKERIIAKFYRPGRWTRKAIEEEHRFVLDCAADEIPVIAPMALIDGNTLGETGDGIFFVLYPKRFGREIEIIDDDGWRRLGMVIARIHLAGARREAIARTLLHPLKTTAVEVNHLLDGGFVASAYYDQFKNTAKRLIDEIGGMFEGREYIRIHGDCHRGNILERPEEGLMIIDFDDMMTGPPVQDLWLLLPEHIQKCRHEMSLILEGYSRMRDFDYDSLLLIEPLRAMRIIYFLDWCSRQIDDFKFQNNFPDWGNDAFWRREVADLNSQLSLIQELRHGFDFGSA